jgi:hypothetical protein
MPHLTAKTEGSGDGYLVGGGPDTEANRMLRLRSNAGIVAVTVASVLTCYVVVIGVAYVLRDDASNGAMAVLFLFGAPILPGASVCVLVGMHSDACVPASLVGNMVFYLAVIFIIRSRRAGRKRLR